MIKICSLDFLNKDVFETDVFTNDGKLIVSKSDKVTSSILLKLYYKNIYVEEVVAEPVVDSQATLAAAEQAEEMLAGAVSQSASMLKEQGVDSVRGPKAAEGVSEEGVSSDAKKGPRSVESVDINTDEESKKGPMLVDQNETQPGPQEVQTPVVSQEEQKPAKIDPEDEFLEFDDAQAKELVEISLKLGRLFNYSPKDLKELEQVAYYSNIGITELKKGDMRKSAYRKMKAHASYKKLIEEGTVPSEIAEIIKDTANHYESASFPLNSKIPYHNIVAITGFYEDMLAKGQEKEKVLLKMLQLGGNHFNIFVLHKFINIMREQ